ncbi:hypothetical protein [Vibrio furnissii]|nr:hypothetical protein [Vibrio furnissii]
MTLTAYQGLAPNMTSAQAPWLVIETGLPIRRMRVKRQEAILILMD